MLEPPQKMQRGGFEPPKALSHKILSLARLTTSLPLHEISNNRSYKKLYKPLISCNCEDDHNSLETPVPFPNTEVKQAML
ncbi:MAG: hypothetical protein RL557_722 [archaeon]